MGGPSAGPVRHRLARHRGGYHRGVVGAPEKLGPGPRPLPLQPERLHAFGGHRRPREYRSGAGLRRVEHHLSDVGPRHPPAPQHDYLRLVSITDTVAKNDCDFTAPDGAGIPAAEFTRKVVGLPSSGPVNASTRWAVVIGEDLLLRLQWQALPLPASVLKGRATFKR
jgi:hypothetical protein